MYSDKSASSSYVDFFYSNQLVFRDIYVAVDGARCYLPLPDLAYDKSTHEISAITVPRDKFEVFRLLNGTATHYDEYASRAGISVTDTPWMN